ncbi:uncharacterized protein V3H82_011638 isoform 2-T3 [Fundulus diaphanus]
MEGFADLLTDAFSESSVPSFSTGDLDFENLYFDEQREEEQTESLMTEADEKQLQEASAEGAALSEGPTADALNTDENTDKESDEEDFTEGGFRSKTPEDDSTSSDEEEDQDAERAEEEGEALILISSGGDVPESRKEDGILDDEDSEVLEDADEIQVMQAEVDSDEEEATGNEKIVESVESEEEEEREEDSSESEYEGGKIEEENVLSEEAGNPYTVDPADSGLEFPSISFQNLQDLISEVDGEAYKEKMTDFTGEEHQEAGESFADYPSDFSPGEYGRNPVDAQRASPHPREGERLERAGTEGHRSEEADSGKEEDFLFTMEMNGGKMTRLDEAGGEEDERKLEHLLSVARFDDEEQTSESDSYSSSDDEEPLRRSSDVFSDKSRTQYLDEDIKLEDMKFNDGSVSNGHNTKHGRYDFLSSGSDVLETSNFLTENLSAEDTDGTDSPPSDINQCPEEGVNSYSVVQREETKTASPITQGSIDDSFFFNHEPDNFPVEGQQEEEEEDDEDEYEERRNFEQMKQRIEAFQRFYDNNSDDENGREERQIKVQFCVDPLSQVNYYDTDSDRDSLSSSSDREEDPSSAEQSDEPKEPEEELNIKAVCDPPVVQQHQSPADIINTESCTKTHKSLSTLKLIATLGAVTGLLMFCLTTDQHEWLRQLFFF